MIAMSAAETSGLRERKIMMSPVDTGPMAPRSHLSPSIPGSLIGRWRTKGDFLRIKSRDRRAWGPFRENIRGAAVASKYDWQGGTRSKTRRIAGTEQGRRRHFVLRAS